jgi:hypothetical protein
VIDCDILIDFEWHRDKKGYRLVPRHSLKMSARAYHKRDDEIVIAPNGQHSDSIRYRPFAGRGDLCAAFALVKSPDELVRFVNDHGPLTDHFFQICENRPPPYTDQMYLVLEPVHTDLHEAEIFRELLRLKAQGNTRKLASYFESRAAFGFCGRGSPLGIVQLVGDSKRGVRFKMGPPDLLGAMWYQLGLKLSNAMLRECPLCHSVFETGVGTGQRADAKFCCHEHKVQFFNHKRSGPTQKFKMSRR